MQKFTLALVLSLGLLTVASAFASPAPSVTSNEIILHFPESATFRAAFASETEITSIVL